MFNDTKRTNAMNQFEKTILHRQAKISCDKSPVGYLLGNVGNSVGCLPQRQSSWLQIFQRESSRISPEINQRADSIAKLYANSYTPIKQTRKQPLTGEARKFNRELAGRRIPIEPVNRWCQIFRMVKETYREKHRNYGKTWNVIAAIVNLRYSAETSQPA